MADFLVSYDKDNQLMLTYRTGEKDRVIKGTYLVAFLENVESLQASIKSFKEKDLIEIGVEGDKLVIPHAKKFLTDPKNKSFLQFLEENKFSVNNYLTVKKTETKKEVPKKTSHPKKKKRINRKKSISAKGTAILLLLIFSLLMGGAKYMISDTLSSSFNLNLASFSVADLFENSEDRSVNRTLNLSGPITYDDYYYYLYDNYYNYIQRYCRVYGVDPGLILKIMTETKAVAANAVLPDGRYGLAGLDLDALRNNAVFAYNFTMENPRIDSDNYNINGETNPEQQIKIAAMLFQQRLRQYDYNFVAALQSMGMTEREFREKIVQYGIEKYGEGLFYGERKESEYIHLVMSDSNDLEWLNRLADENGETFASRIMGHYLNDSIIPIKVCRDNQKAETYLYRFQDGTVYLDMNQNTKRV